MRCPGASGARTFTCAVGPEATAPSGRANRRLCTSSVSLEASAATSTSRLSSVHWLRNSLRRSAQSPHDSGHSSRTATPSKRGSGSTSQIESKRAPQDWESMAQVTDGAGQPVSKQGHGPASTQGGAAGANIGRRRRRRRPATHARVPRPVAGGGATQRTLTQSIAPRIEPRPRLPASSRPLRVAGRGHFHLTTLTPSKTRDFTAHCRLNN